MLKRIFICMAITAMLFIPAFTVSANESNDLLNQTATIDPNNVDEIMLDDKYTKLLPQQVQDSFKVDGKMVASVVSVYELSTDPKISGDKVISQRNFDLSKEDEIVNYNHYISELDKQSDNQIKGTISDCYLQIGLVVTQLQHGEWDDYFQLQGWWEWSEDAFGAYEPMHDTMGLAWSAPLAIEDGSEVGYANSIWNSSSVDIDYFTFEDNEGTLFKQTSYGLSEGAVLTRIFHGLYNNTPFAIRFTYSTCEPTVAGDWGVWARDLVWCKLGFPTPPNGDQMLTEKVTRYY